MAMPPVINIMTEYLKKVGSISTRGVFHTACKAGNPQSWPDGRPWVPSCPTLFDSSSTRHDRVSCLAEWSESTFDNRILMSCTRLLKTLLKVYHPHFTCYFANSVRSWGKYAGSRIYANTLPRSWIRRHMVSTSRLARRSVTWLTI